MQKGVVIFGGTTEGRLLSYELAEAGAAVTVCVATEYGREEQGETAGIRVLAGRKDSAAMAALLQGALLCIDATHPYATEATKTIQDACRETKTPYHRLLRDSGGCQGISFDTPAQAAGWLAARPGKILLTTGTKDLAAFDCLARERLYVRVLPNHRSLDLCELAGIPHRNILAMQGPFSQQLNEALIKQFAIRYLVTKDGGITGGFREKAAAAAAAGIALLVLRRTPEQGETYEEIVARCKELIGCK